MINIIYVVLIILDLVMLGFIVIHLLYLKKVHREDVERDAAYTKLIDEHIDKIDEHISKMESNNK